MSEAQADSEEESPFFTLDPIVVAKIISICQERV